MPTVPKHDIPPIGHFQEVQVRTFPLALKSVLILILPARTQNKQRVRVFIIGITILMNVFDGCSRVYLGVHWPMDVLAGWALGGTWAVLLWLIAMKVGPKQAERAGPARSASN